jgi:hypothetical protein
MKQLGPAELGPSKIVMRLHEGSSCGAFADWEENVHAETV